MTSGARVHFLRAAAAAALVLSACTAADEPSHTDIVAAAERLCPVMWDWVKDMGDAFNAASSDVASIDDAGGRRDRWLAALLEMRSLNDRLQRDVAAMSDAEVIAGLIDEILDDVPRSNEEIESLEALIQSSPEVDEERHQARTAQLIVRVEKVIDLPKPDLVPLDPNGVLLPAFREVPSCQHSIRDVDVGTVQVND